MLLQWAVKAAGWETGGGTTADTEKMPHHLRTGKKLLFSE